MPADHRRIRTLASEDAEHLERKARSYGDSWRRRGGVDSFMMLARKWDRIEKLAALHNGNILKALQSGNDERERLRRACDQMLEGLLAKAAMEADEPLSTAVAAIRDYIKYLEARQDDPAQDVADLRRYLLLVEEYATRPGALETDGMGWDEAAEAAGVPGPYAFDPKRAVPDPDRMGYVDPQTGARLAKAFGGIPAEKAAEAIGSVVAARFENKLPGELEGETPE